MLYHTICSKHFCSHKINSCHFPRNKKGFWPHCALGAFKLHLLEFNFVYQFYSRKTNLVKSRFQNPVGLFAFMSFHNHFKLFWYCVLLKMRGIFCPYLFWGLKKKTFNIPLMWIYSTGAKDVFKTCMGR